MEVATRGLSFPDGCRKSLYGSMRITAVFPVVLGSAAILRSIGKDLLGSDGSGTRGQRSGK